MRLLIDIGNSRIKWAWQSGREIGPSDAIVYVKKDLANELPILWQDLAAPQQVWVASVADTAVAKILNQFLSSQWGVTAHYVQSTKSALGITNAYLEPQQLGCDRWAAMLAAYGREQNCVLIADCGTAVTVDAIDAHGRHLGGAIAPGIALCYTVLNQQTNLQWQSTETILPTNVFMDTTARGIVSGIGYSVVGLIEHTYQQLTAAGHHPVVYVTGGDAAYISSALSIEHKQSDDLVLQGLAILADHT